jgi:hypothetical protein
MSSLSPLHQLCDAPTCYPSLHRLRWTDRPLPWPRCQSYAVGPWGA